MPNNKYGKLVAELILCIEKAAPALFGEYTNIPAMLERLKEMELSALKGSKEAFLAGFMITRESANAELLIPEDLNAKDAWVTLQTPKEYWTHIEQYYEEWVNGN